MDRMRAAADASVVEMLRAIEDKLYETGLLVTATGDPESDVTLAFEEVEVSGCTVFALTVQVGAPPDSDLARPGWSALRQYVAEKFSMLQSGLPEDVRELLLDGRGPLVVLNGVLVP